MNGKVDTFRMLLESAAEAVVIVDAMGRIVFANHRAEHVFGYQRDEMLGQEVEVLVPEPLRQVHRRHRSHYLVDPHNRPMGIGLHLLGRRRDGSEFPVEISLTAVGEGDDRLIMASVTDITQRRALERSLEENEARYHSLIDAIVDSSSAGIVIRNADFKVVWLNKAMEELFGIQRFDAVGEDARNLVQVSIAPKVITPDNLADRLLAGESLELRVLPHDGREERWVEFRSEPVRSGLLAGGSIDHFFDITAIKCAEESNARLKEERIRQLEQEMRSLEILSGVQVTSITAEAFGLAALREGHADIFDDFVLRFGELMDKALDQCAYKVDHGVNDQLRAIAETLGRVGAKPRDIVEIYATALKNKTGSTPVARADAYHKEGRLMALELMGYLASFYRAYCQGWRHAASAEEGG